MTPEQEAEIREATEETRSSDAALRRAGLKRLQQQGAAGLEPLLALLGEHMGKRRRVGATLTALTWLLLPFSLFLMPGVLLSMCIGHSGLVVSVALVVWTVNWLLFVIRSRIPMTARQREIVEVFAEINDLRAIGPLLNALGPQPENDPPMLRITLTRLLKQIRASDAALLTPRQRGILYRELVVKSRHQLQCDFVIAILKALEQVGTTSAIPYVAQLAQRTYPFPAPPDVVKAAWQCLGFLRDHTGEMTTRQTLLRASNPNDVRPDTLLRPTQEQQETQSEILLRPNLPPKPDSPDPADTDAAP